MCELSRQKMAAPNETGSLTERNTTKLLKHMGRKLLKYLTSADKLLELLDKLELILSSLNQGPAKPLKESLVHSMKALISDELLHHRDQGVQISVASCLAEITRITAPEVPYNDEQMKEMFKVTVRAFEKLSHVSGHGYDKALAILDNVSNIRLCLVMLDLECEDLIIEMFQHFLRFTRSDHPRKAIDSMESIMTLLLAQSENITVHLLRPLLDSVRNENQTISPISWALGEKVITNCAVTLKPFMMKAVELSGRALNEYAPIVTSICQNGSESPQCDHSSGSKQTVVQVVEDKFDVPKDAYEQPSDATKGHVLDITCERDVLIMDDTKSIRSAGASTDGEAIKKSGSKMKPGSEISKNSKRSNGRNNFETSNLESIQEAKSESQLTIMPRKRGRKPNSLMNAEEGYDRSWIYPGTKSRKSAVSRKARNSSTAFPPSDKITSRRKDKLHPKPKTVSEALVSEQKSEKITKSVQSRTEDIGSDCPPYENLASDMENVLSKPEETSKGCEALAFKHKISENTNAAAFFTNNDIPDGFHTKGGRRRKIKNTGNQDIFPSAVSMLKEDKLKPLLQETSLDSPRVELQKESEVKPIRKIIFSMKIDGKTAAAPELVVAKTEPIFSCGDEGKHELGTNTELANIEGDRSSAQTKVEKKWRLNVTPNKGLNKSSAVKELKIESASKTLNGVEENSQARLRRRHSNVSVEASESRNPDNSLVGSRIKVWWPMDRTFYEGVVDSYDSIKGKHKILYADGDIEVLNLKKQRWELVSVNVSLDKEGGLALQKLAEASDIAEKSKEKSEMEPTKGAKIKSRSRGRASASIPKSESIKSAVKSVDTSVVDLPALADESIDDPPRTVGGKDSVRKPKTKKIKTGSDMKKNKSETDDPEKEKAQRA
ncbi:uncharacterized protein LOC113857095 [Abrus precatorius]|uniref:Uncharacterized protein LOC113857095 n=1 Tax=Abrus precatorius TaxID=3816 RepID=A0A8B8KLG2_ABRPR|nr:uncharacterized protein LOC113857095 [Abrus precatorius]XP_027344631.1 uncharacterized protein LOC113857095 [Abrus precatorius]